MVTSFDQQQDDLRALIWKRGIQVPPFCLGNAAAVQLCESILAGTIANLPNIIVSEAVAVLIYRMCHSKEGLDKAGMKGV